MISRIIKLAAIAVIAVHYCALHVLEKDTQYDQKPGKG